jgi:hypothetical protein
MDLEVELTFFNDGENEISDDALRAKMEDFLRVVRAEAEVRGLGWRSTTGYTYSRKTWGII